MRKEKANDVSKNIRSELLIKWMKEEHMSRRRDTVLKTTQNK